MSRVSYYARLDKGGSPSHYLVNNKHSLQDEIEEADIYRLEVYSLPAENYTKKIKGNKGIYNDRRDPGKAARYYGVEGSASNYTRNKYRELGDEEWSVRKDLLRRWYRVKESIDVFDDELKLEVNAYFLEEEFNIEEAKDLSNRLSDIYYENEIAILSSYLHKELGRVTGKYITGVYFTSSFRKLKKFKEDLKGKRGLVGIKAILNLEKTAIEEYLEIPEFRRGLRSVYDREKGLRRARSPEWLHSIADSLGGPTELINLSAGSYAANTQMLVIESAVQGNKDIGVSVTSYCKPATKLVMLYEYTVFGYDEVGSYISETFEIDGQRQWYTREDARIDETKIKSFLSKVSEQKDVPQHIKHMPYIQEVSFGNANTENTNERIFSTAMDSTRIFKDGIHKGSGNKISHREGLRRKASELRNQTNPRTPKKKGSQKKRQIIIIGKKQKR